jgi:eukaryotic-like serine/threonine-protein kinase
MAMELEMVENRERRGDDPRPFNAERAAQIDRALAAALEAEPGERDGALRAACGDDVDLRREVEEMLRAAETPDSLLRSGGAISEALLDEVPRLDGGALLGRYRILRAIGRGGMGVVYLAERADGEFEQRVAIKLLHRETEGDHLARFHRERQILAQLEHPNIARLIDGGTTDRGHPYLVMEYVEGLPIDRYCQERQLSLRERIGLLVTVCRAVQAAHRRLVVHRDLKPANILVSPEGQVKLLDFGIARVLVDGDPTGVGPTVSVGHALTPQYASPEQVSSQPVGVASDVYQLGLLAYELVAGRRPYELADSGLHQALQLICDREPEPPGVATDFDLIVLQALRKEPGERYGSVDLLREDLERFIGGLPVSARPATWTYRAGRFIARNTLAVTVSAVAVLAFLGLGAGFTWRLADERDQTRQALVLAQEGRAQADERRQESEEVIAFLSGLFSNADPFATGPSGEPPDALALLERGAERLEDELAERPLIRARLLRTVGAILCKRGRYERGVPLLEEAVALLRGAPDSRRLDLAGGLKALGSVYLQFGKEGAREVLEESLEIQTELLGAEHPQVAMTLLNLANLSFNDGRFEDAERSTERVLAILRRQPEPDVYLICQALVGLGSSLNELGRFDEAYARFEEARELSRDARLADHPLMAVILEDLAITHGYRGEHSEAVPLYRQALEMFERSLGEKHPMVAEVLVHGAGSDLALGRLDEAESALRRSLTIREEVFGASHLQTAETLAALAEVELRRGRPDAAERLARRVLAIAPAAIAEEHPVRQLARTRLREALIARGRDGEAAALEPPPGAADPLRD